MSRRADGRSAVVGWVGGAAFVLTVNALLLGLFHDRFWAAADDGHYAHVAERLLDGEILNVEVESVHAGYHHFVNAAALAAFGRRMVSLRYPLVAMAATQSLLLFALFLPRGVAIAVITALASTALGVVQFMNPSPYWWSLFPVVALGCWLTWVSPGGRGRLEGAGFLVGLAALCQQLPGTLAGMGALTYLMLEGREGATAGRPTLARVAIALMLAAVGLHLWKMADGVGLLLFGLWPILLLVWTWTAVALSDRAFLAMLGRLGLGAGAAALPLLLYHLLHGSLAAWLHDALWRSVGFPELSFLRLVSHGAWVSAGVDLLLAPRRASDVLNGLYWTILPLLAALCGLALVSRVVRRGTGDASDTALPCLAVFHALVAVRFQIPVYLYYTVGLSLAGWLWLLGRRTWLGGGIAVALSVVGVVYHAGEPFRSVEGMIGGERRPLVRSDSLPRLGVRVDGDDLETYRSLIDLIHRTTRPDEPIFALPYDPELYFLSERRNPFPFSLLPLHLAGQHDADAVIHTLLEQPPALVIHNRTDKYNEPSVGPIVEAVQRHYRLLAAVGPFDVYRPAAAGVAD